MAKNLNKKTASPEKIFLAEDHPTFREGLAQIINSGKDLTVCGEADTAEQALAAINRLRPDLMLVDISLPGKSGLELIKKLRSKNRKVKLLVLSMHDEALYANRVLRAGGDGYIMKQEDPEEIVQAIRDVLQGRIYISEEVLENTPTDSREDCAGPKTRPLQNLTDSELEILEGLGRGKSNQEIARQLRMSVAAVTTHCRRIMKELNLQSTNALIRYAVCWREADFEQDNSRGSRQE